MKALTSSLFASAQAASQAVLAPAKAPKAMPRQGALWVGLWCESSVLAGAFDPVPSEPAAVVEQHQGRLWVAAVNAAAQRQGVAEGMALGAGLALCGELQWQRRAHGREREHMALLAQHAQRWTPTVVLQSEGVLLEVAASTRLFGGAETLKSRIEREMRDYGDCWVAMAPTPESAWLLAKHKTSVCVKHTRALASALGALPVASLPLAQRSKQRLARCGVTTLNELVRLPRAGLARRFGAEVLQWLDRLYGRTPDIRPLYRAPWHWHRERHLLEPCRGKQQLQNELEALLRQASKALRQHQRAAERITFEVRGSGSDQPLRWSIGVCTASQDFAHFQRILQLRLASMDFPEEVLFYAVSLPQSVPYEAHTEDWLRASANERDWQAQLDEVREKLGENALYQLALRADPRPECAWQKGTDQARPAPNLPCRPVWLHLQPVRIPRGHLQGTLSAPERIESGWWDQGDCRRDYYRLRTPGQMDRWVFWDWRANAWFEHGLFA